MSNNDKTFDSNDFDDYSYGAVVPMYGMPPIPNSRRIQSPQPKQSKDNFEKLIENINLAKSAKDEAHKKLAICSIQIIVNDLIKENNISHKDIEAVMQLMGVYNDNSK